MESFQLSFGIVMSMFLTLVAGWCLRCFQVLQASGFDAINVLCFKVLLPVPFFCNTYGGRDLRLLDGRVFVRALVCQVLILSLLFLTVPRTFEKSPARVSIIQACSHSNFIMFEMMIAGELGLPDELMVASALTGVLIPLYNTGGVGILEYYWGGKLEPGRVTKQVGSNPLAISCMVSLVLVALKVKSPMCVEMALEDVTSCANPTSFLALGGCLNLMSVGSYKKETLTGVGYRLAFQSVVFLGLSYLLGFRGIELSALVAMLISSTVVATCNMVRSMDADGELAGHPVVFQSLGSMVTIFLWILLLSGLGVLQEEEEGGEKRVGRWGSKTPRPEPAPALE